MPKLILDYLSARTSDDPRSRTWRTGILVATPIVSLAGGFLAAFIGIRLQIMGADGAGLGVLHLGGLLFVLGCAIGQAAKTASSPVYRSVAAGFVTANLYCAVFLNVPLAFYWFQQLMEL